MSRPVPESIAPRTAEPRQPVIDLIAAFNARDLDAMLVCLSATVTFCPLRLHGVDRVYKGHDGIARWFDLLARYDYTYHIDLDNVDSNADGGVLAIGEVRSVEQDHLAPFWGIYQITGTLITAGRHYLTDPDIADQLGSIR